MNKLFLLILTLAGAYPIAHCANNEFEPNLPLPLDVPAIEDNRQSTLGIERNGVLYGADHIRKAKILDSGYANISGFVGGVISFGPFACATYKLSSVLKIDSAYRVYFAGILTPIAASLLPVRSCSSSCGIRWTLWLPMTERQLRFATGWLRR